MPEPGTTSMDDCGLTLNAQEDAAVRSQLERILVHLAFRNTPRCQRFLSHVVDYTLKGDFDSLKERLIGIQVFNMDADYDVNQHPVVRTAANEVRKRLAQYYDAPGHESEIRISLPSGGYRAEFHTPSDDIKTGTELTVLDQMMVPASKPSSLRKTSKQLLWILPVLLAAVILSVLGLKKPPTSVDLFLGPILKTDLVLFCLGGNDSWFVDPSLRLGNENGLLSVSDAAAASQLTYILDRHTVNYRFQEAYTADQQEMKYRPVIYLGILANPWIENATKPLRYHFKMIPNQEAWIEDSKNPGNHQWLVTAHPTEQTAAEDYAIAARYFDPAMKQYIVVVSGIGEAGTFAAAEVLFQTDYLDELKRVAPKNWESKNIEIVIGVRKAKTPQHPWILAAEFW